MAGIITKSYKRKRTITVIDVNTSGRSNVTRIRPPEEHDVDAMTICQTTTDSNRLPASDINNQNETVNSVSYSNRRAALETGWEEARKILRNVFVESVGPGHLCSRCGTEVTETVICDDCGPGCQYCEECCVYIHQYVWYHRPKIWKVLMFNHFMSFTVHIHYTIS
jgi:hypothetical protein